MSMMIGPLFALGSKLIDKLFTSPEEKAKAQLELMRLERAGDLEEMKTQLSVILAEAQSPDKWTSRARPSFLYVCYLLILFAIPMGILSAFSPDTAVRVSDGFNAWLKGIPEAITDLMKWVMLGYIGGRSFEKLKGVAK